MEFAEVVRKRRMIRRYDPGRTIDRATLTELIELATRAPSAGFTQGWHFLVLDTTEDRQLFWRAATDASAEPDAWLAGMRAAPVLVLALCDKSAYLDRYAEPDKGWTDRDEARWSAPYWHIDTGMAALLVLLGATDRGLGGCFFGVPAERRDALRAALSIPARLEFTGVVSLGHAAPTSRRSRSLRRGRRPLADVVHFGRMADS